MAVDHGIVLRAVLHHLKNIERRVDSFFELPNGITAGMVPHIRTVAETGILLGLAKRSILTSGTLTRGAESDAAITVALRSYRGSVAGEQAADERAALLDTIDAQIMEFNNGT